MSSFVSVKSSARTSESVRIVRGMVSKFYNQVVLGVDHSTTFLAQGRLRNDNCQGLDDNAWVWQTRAIQLWLGRGRAYVVLGRILVGERGA